MMPEMMVWMVLLGAVVVALVGFSVVGIISMVQRSARERDQVPLAASPDDMLKQRYAAGEIDEDEYLRRRAGLQA